MPANKFTVLGLTGGIGCGKTEAAAYLETLGAVQADADAISRALTAEGGAALPDIRAAFGDGVFAGDGTLNRAALAAQVFADAEKKARLEGILHPLVLKTTKQIIREAREDGKSVCVLNVPLLFETGMDALCDTVWVLDADEETQVERVMLRGLTRDEALSRIRNQMPRDARLARADKVIDTRGTFAQTRAVLKECYGKL